MSRIQLALNVEDLDAEIARYSKMFGVGPAKVRPGYANFAIADPPMKLVLIQGHGAAGTPARVRIRARDVMLALEEPRNISALNILRGTVAEISPSGAASVNVRLDCGGAAVVARITRHSAAALELAPGKPAYAVVKAVSVSGPAGEPR